MNEDLHHPVMLNEAIAAMNLSTASKVVDGTYGRGGHTAKILDVIEGGRLVLYDVDPQAVSHAEAKLKFDPRVTIKQTSFSRMKQDLIENGLWQKINAVLLDLGVSSPQLDCAERGFSFRHEGPLDMRFDPQNGISAEKWLATANQNEIAMVVKNYGEEPRARRIAQAIVARRAAEPITSTTDLANLIEHTIPARSKQTKHPATRVFLAFRIFLNDELKVLQDGIANAFEALAPQGRLVVISFHSLEDRIVKRFFHKQVNPESSVPKRLPLSNEVLTQMRTARAICGPVRPSVAEIEKNPRSRSALLRSIEKL